MCEQATASWPSETAKGPSANGSMASSRPSASRHQPVAAETTSLSARAETHWSTENSRGDWSVRTETYATMTSDATDFHLSARLEAYEGDMLVFEKELSERIPRDCR